MSNNRCVKFKKKKNNKLKCSCVVCVQVNTAIFFSGILYYQYQSCSRESSTIRSIVKQLKQFRYPPKNGANFFKNFFPFCFYIVGGKTKYFELYFCNQILNHEVCFCI